MALTNFLTTDKALASVLNDKVVTPANTHISTAEGHFLNTSNPHSVTKTQIGLGNVTDDAQIPKSIIDAAGDLIYGTADNTPGRLAKGTDGQMLTLASGLPSWVNGTRIARGYFADTTTSFSATVGELYTKTIPIGFNALSGRIFIKRSSAPQGAILFFDTVDNNTISAATTNSTIIYKKQQDTVLSHNMFSTSGDLIAIKSCYISGSDLIIQFVTSGGATRTLGVNCLWEVTA